MMGNDYGATTDPEMEYDISWGRVWFYTGTLFAALVAWAVML